MKLFEGYTPSYAQNREDIILAAFFRPEESGFYVDVGANHPVHDSVTNYFYERGWHGINIEPNKRLYKALIKARPHDINLQIGVANKAGKLKIREYEERYDGLSTFSELQQKERDGSIEYIDRIVEVRTLAEILKEQNIKNISFMKVDVEGFEYEVLKGNDWNNYRPQVICIEANHIRRDWRPLLKKYGYSLVFFDGLNEYYLSKEAEWRGEYFSYVKGIIGRNVIPYSLFESFQDFSREHEFLKRENEKKGSEIEAAKFEVHRLNQELAELQRVVPLMKRLLKSLDRAARIRIERLNGHKKKRIIPFQQGVSSSPQSLFKEVHAYDFRVHYTKHAKRVSLRYRVVVTIYGTLFRMCFSGAKLVFRIMRRVKSWL